MQTGFFLLRFVIFFQILKLYAWEMSFKEKIEAIRNIELSLLKKESIIGLFFWFSWILAPYMVNEKILIVKFKIYFKNQVYESNSILVIYEGYFILLSLSATYFEI